jgi:hypothetical protein
MYAHWYAKDANIFRSMQLVVIKQPCQNDIHNDNKIKKKRFIIHFGLQFVPNEFASCVHSTLVC